jgi:tight adherence protein B
MLEILAAAFVFIAVTACLIVLLRTPTLARSVETRLDAVRRRVESRQLEGAGFLRGDRTSSLPFLRDTLSGSRWTERTRRELQRAGLPLKVGEYLMIRVLAGGLASLAAFVLFGGGVLALMLMPVAFVLGFIGPALYVNLQKGRRKAALNRQLVEALQLISNSLRSGFAFTQAVELAAKQLSPPIRDEFNHFLRDTALGARSEDALRDLVERTDSVDIEMMVTSIMVQRITGGNLSEILDNVAETIRERERLQREIRALTAQQRLTGTILSIYPAILGLLFFLISPSLMKVLWEEEAGRLLLALALVLQISGFLMIRNILKLEV